MSWPSRHNGGNLNPGVPQTARPSLKAQPMRGNVGALVLVLVGAFFLASNLGLINVSLRELISTWWPLILIALGIGMFFTPGGPRRK